MLNLVSVVFLAVAQPADLSGLTLRVTVSKKDLLVGESTKAVIRWALSRPTRLDYHRMILLLDGGSGFKRYYELGSTGEEIALPFDGPAGWSMTEDRRIGVTNDALGSGKYDKYGFAFPHPGRYRLKAQYETVESNVVTIEVKAPTGRDAELFAKYLVSRPRVLTFLEGIQNGEPGLWELGNQLVELYPDSVYLARLRLRLWEARIRDAENQFPSDTLKEMENSPLEGTPFEEDRLNLVGEHKLRRGDREGARRAFEEMIQKFPEGALSARAKQRLDVESKNRDDDERTSRDRDPDR